MVETGKIAITKYGLIRNPRTGFWSGTIKLTNTGTSAFSGPIFVLFNLPAGAILENATGTYDGLPYLEVNVASLAAGATISATVVFNSSPPPATQPRTTSSRSGRDPGGEGGKNPGRDVSATSRPPTTNHRPGARRERVSGFSPDIDGPDCGGRR